MRTLCGRRGILCFGRRSAETSTPACAGDESVESAVPAVNITKGSGSTLILQDEEEGSRNSKGFTRLGVWGIVLITIACLMAALDPRKLFLQQVLSMSEGSFVFGLWRKPPVTVLLRVYIFNVTNAEAFVRGEERMRMEEIGPYVYREVLENNNPSFGSGDDDSLTYEPRRTVHWVAEESRGSLQDKIIVPNIPLIAFSSAMHNSPNWMNMAFSMVANYVSSKPFLEVSVEEYFWGHEEPLLTLAAKVLPSYITFSSFGLLDRLYSVGPHNMTIGSGNLNPMSKFQIEKVNGETNLGLWAWDEYPHPDETMLHDACELRDSVSGTYEGLLYPLNLQKNSEIRMYRDAFCRSILLKYEKDVMLGGDMPALRFQPADGYFNSTSPENACVCMKNHDRCLPDGLSDVSPCYFNIPAAASYPHWYQSDPALHEKILGMDPVKEKHETYVDIQPEVGIPLAAHSRIQLNLVVKDTSRVRRAALFKNLIIPIVWTDLSLDGLPNYLMNYVHLAVVTMPVVQKGVILGMSCIGVAMVLACFMLNFSSWFEEKNKTDVEKAAKKWSHSKIIPAFVKARLYAPVDVLRTIKDSSDNDESQKKLCNVETVQCIQNSSSGSLLVTEPLLEHILPVPLRNTCV